MNLIKLKEKLSEYKKEDVIFGKVEKYILERINSSREEVVAEILSCKNLDFVEAQNRGDETRYVLFFIYSKKIGRVYVIKFNSKLRIITAYPLGRKTLLKYKKKRFIS